MPYIDGLPAATSVSNADLLVLDQGGTGVPGSATTVSATVAQLKAGLSFVSGTTTAHGVVVGAGTNAVTVASPGTSGYVLTSTGATTDPTFQVPALQSIAATSLLANATGGSAAPSAVTLGRGLAFSGSTLAASYNYAGGGIWFEGAPFLQQMVGLQGSTIMGPGAGAALPAGSIFSTMIGYNAGHNYTGATGEATLIGTIAGQFLVDGTFATALGENALGQEVHGPGCTAIGNDAMRSYVGPSGFNTAIGKSAMITGGGSTNTALGSSALCGNSSVVTFGGAATLADRITLTFTGSFTGSPASCFIDVTAGQTTTQMATAMAAAIAANSTIFGNALVSTAAGQSGAALTFVFPGTSTTGSSIVITSGVTGSATETVTITGGTTGTDNVALGYRAMAGQYSLTTATGNVAIGANAANALSSGTSNVIIGSGAAALLSSATSSTIVGAGSGGSALSPNGLTVVGASAAQSATGFGTHIGFQAGKAQTSGNSTFVGLSAGLNVTTGTNVAVGGGALQGAAASTANLNTAVGDSTLQLITTGSQNQAFGRLAGSKITTGVGNVVIGSSVAGTTLQTGSTNILIGVDSSTDTAATGTSDTLLIKGKTGGTAPFISGTAGNATPTVILGGVSGVSATTSITAHAGGTQASAIALTTGSNLITVCATAADSVKLPVTTIPGIWVMVTNNGAASCQLFGAGTDTINGVATATGVAIAAGKTWHGHAPATGTWFGGTLT